MVEVSQELLDKGINALGFNIAYENISQAPEDEFGRIRLMGFGASDSSKLLGVNPFNTRADILLEKINEEYDESISALPNVRKGRELEPMILEKASEYFEKPILKPAHMYGDGEGMLVNFDGVMVEDDRLIPVEAKLCSIYGRKYYEFTKAAADYYLPEIRQKSALVQYDGTRAVEAAKYYGIPVYYYTQLQQQIHFLNAPYGYLSVLDDKEWTLRVFKIHRNEEVINEIIRETHIAQAIVEERRNGRNKDN